MFKRQKLIVIFCLIFIGEGKSFAGILENATMGEHSADIKYERLYLNFNASDQIKAKGWMEGIGFSYTFHSSKNLIIKPEFWLDWGSLEYEGPLAYSGNSVTARGKIDDVDTFLFEIRGLIGYDFQISEASSLTPYIGLGYRYFDMDMDEKVTYTNGTRTTKIGSKWYADDYIPLGIKFSQNTYAGWSNGWSFAATVEDDILLDKRGNGLRGSIELLKRFKYINFAVEPFVRYWKFAEVKRVFRDGYGDKLGDIEEPAKHITETGIALKLRF